MEIIKKRFGIDPSTDPAVQGYAEDFRIAQLVYDARTAAGLTEEQLAEKVGTTADVISQLEDADYEGNPLAMLRRIAKALHMEVELRLVPESASN
jgi:transcriptional regulator with XRE-family HTH domain